MSCRAFTPSAPRTCGVGAEGSDDEIDLLQQASAALFRQEDARLPDDGPDLALGGLQLEAGRRIGLRATPNDGNFEILGATFAGHPLLQCAELMVRFFCVGEALSIPLLRGTWKAARHPLPRAVLGRIVKDEAAHGTSGYMLLDWAEPQLTQSDRRLLGAAADLAIDAVLAQWDDLRRRPESDWHEGNALAWMATDAYLELAARSMNENVLGPLRERGIPVSRLPNGA